MLPFVPVPPALWRVVLEVFWIPTAVAVAISGRHPRPGTVTSLGRTRRFRRRPRDAFESFFARLRA
jgi:hypothetical protein